MKKTSGNDNAVQAIKMLHSEGPDPRIKDKLMTFGQFVGDWNIIEDKILREDGTWSTFTGELHWGWILGGMAVQDVWSFKGNEEEYRGTTVRFYNPDIDSWHSVWFSPEKKMIRVFTGRSISGEIVLETRDPDGSFIHWIFYDVEKNSFSWRAEISQNGERDWKVVEKMVITRQM